MKQDRIQRLAILASAWLFVVSSLMIWPAGLKAQAVLDNSKLRFGTGYEASVNSNGNLQQPFYFNAVQRAWRKLTFSARICHWGWRQ
jgi:hypothetical protein